MSKLAQSTAKLLEQPAMMAPHGSGSCWVATTVCQRRMCCLRCHPGRQLAAAACALMLGLSALLWLSATAGPQQQQPQVQQRLRLPRILHFTARSEKLYSDYLPLMRSWIEAYPDFQFYLWRDADVACLARLRYPSWLPEFNGSARWFQTPLERSDFSRILALHALGGLYVDLDTKRIADISHLLDKPLAGVMLATEPAEHATLIFGLDYLVSNAVMFSAPGHPFLVTYIDTIEAIAKKRSSDPRKRTNTDAPGITGPLAMQEAYGTYRSNEEVACSSPDCRVHLFPPEVFSPAFDPCQLGFLRSFCNATTLAQLPDGKRNICVRLWARNFTQAKVGYDTLGAHLFSHASTYPSLTPTFFDARVAFPQLRFFADSVRGC